ncbi:zinc-binding dehydrogenase [Kribbella sp. NPDC026611]|uniref:quinone oxidoreductase family protein n=1 Tax=Kribbella sp. NPDC026611 TaxID=3154911 RepID=UPI0033FA4C7B
MRAMMVEQPGGPEVLRLGERPKPTPGPGEVSVEVQYAGAGFVDTLFRAGKFGLPTPFVPGLEVTGRVRAMGNDVHGLSVGQTVAALLNDFGRTARAGGYAEVVVAHASMTCALPRHVDPAVIAGVLINGVTAWLALHDLARLAVTDTVLVLGASGGLGGITGRLAALRPARQVIAVVGSPGKRQAVVDAGGWTDVVLADELDQLSELDVVIDSVGGELRAQAFDLLAPFGRMVVLGNASGDDRALSGDAFWHGTRQVQGLSLGSVAHLIPDKVGTALRAVVDLVARDVLREPKPDVQPLKRAADVHRALESRSAPAKTVLAVS